MKSETTPIHQLIVKVVQRCNLNCTYCYMYNHVDQSFSRKPALMADEIFEAMLSRVQEYCASRPSHKMELIFHGGEPMLLGPDRFSSFARNARLRLGEHLSSISMQTNATLASDKWAQVLRDNDIRVGISIDGPKEIHDLARVDHSGRGSYDAALAGLLKLQEAGLFALALCVVTPGRSGLATYRHFRDLGIRRMNFLIPDATHDSKPLLYGNLGGTPVADFLIPIFDAWFAEDNPDVQILLFKEIIRKLLSGSSLTDAVGGGKPGYLVIDSDGEIQYNDVFKVCDEGLADSGLNVLTSGFDGFSPGSLLSRLESGDIPLSQICQSCGERSVCGGGHLPHRYSRARQFDNPSVWCPDLFLLINHIRSAITDDNSHERV